MGRGAKIGLVAGGYAGAVLAGIVAAWWYDARVSALPYDTSGGMYAGGEAMTSIAVFLMVALAPTVMGLWFLRRHHGFWNTVAVASLAFAIAGLVAVLAAPAYRDARNLVFLFANLLWLAQLLGAPFWLIAFALFTVLAPTRSARRLLIGAIAVEVVIGVCALVHWFSPRPPF